MKIATVGKSLWYMRTETHWDMQLQEKNPLQGGKGFYNSTTHCVSLYNKVQEDFP